MTKPAALPRQSNHNAEDGQSPSPRSSNPAPEPEDKNSHDPPPRQTDWPKADPYHVDVCRDDAVGDDHQDHAHDGGSNDGDSNDDAPEPGMSGMTFHRFDADIAERYGLHEAVIFQYLAYCANLNPRKTVSKSQFEIEQACPYLGRNQVRLALKNLCWNNPRSLAHPVGIIERVADGPICTDVGVYKPKMNLYRPKSPSLHKFDVNVAGTLGVLAAIIYSNLHHWIFWNWKCAMQEKGETLNSSDYDSDTNLLNFNAFEMTRSCAKWRVTPAEWSLRHPYASLRSIERSFAALANARYLQVKSGTRNRPWWSLPEAVMNQFRDRRIAACDYTSKWQCHHNTTSEISNGAWPESTSTAKTTKLPPKGPSHRQNGQATAKTAKPLSEISTPACVKQGLSNRLKAQSVEADFGAESIVVKDITKVRQEPNRSCNFASAQSSPEATNYQKSAGKLKPVDGKPVKKFDGSIVGIRLTGNPSEVAGSAITPGSPAQRGRRRQEEREH